MKNMKKFSIIAILLVTLTLISSNVYATTANELKDYICNPKGIAGTNLVIRDSDKVKVERFFSENSITDEQATQIKNIIDKAIALMTEDGATEPRKLSSYAKKEQLLNYAKEAATIAGFTVSYDVAEGRLDIYKNGVLYESLNWGISPDGTNAKEALIQTGNTNYIYLGITSAILIAIIALFVVNKGIKKYEKAEQF